MYVANGGNYVFPQKTTITRLVASLGSGTDTVVSMDAAKTILVLKQVDPGNTLSVSIVADVNYPVMDGSTIYCQCPSGIMLYFD